MDRMKNRFSSKRFQKTIDSLTEDQKGFIVKHGFQNLLNVQKFSIPVSFLEWIMSQLVIHKAEFKHRRKSFKLTRFMVQQILGIPSGDNPIVLCNADLKPCDTSAQPNPAFNHGTKLSIDDAVAKLLAEHDEEAFMRMFMIVAISTIFCPSTENFVNLNYLPYLLDISQIQTYDWSSHVLNYILSEVKKYQAFISSKDDGYIYVGSCLPILAVSFFLFLYDIFH